MSLSYDPLLVTLSVAVAMFASFVGLNLAGRLLVADRGSRLWWLSAAALALGGGIWSMHFIGMLAWQMPMPATYSFDLTVVSLILPIVVVAIGLEIPLRRGLSWLRLLASGIIIALGIVSMHYSGMSAMHMHGMAISYDPALVAASVVIALTAATGAVWLAFNAKATRERVVAAVVMGVAIAGMHYTGMAAASVELTSQPMHMDHHAVASGTLAITVGATTFGLLLLGLTTAYFDRKLATLTAREAEALRQNEARHRVLIRNSDGIIAVLDAEGTITYEGSSAAAILGYSTDVMIGRKLTAFLPESDAAHLATLVAEIARQAGAEDTLEFPMRHRDGSWRDFAMTARNLIDDPVIGGVVVNLRDITVSRGLMRRLEEISETDLLTGMMNRRGFTRLAERAMERARRHGRPLTLVMLDLDHFKRVNDTYGHAAGDLVLAMIADRCKAAIRSTDVLGRLGGEEFVLLLDAEVNDAQALLSRLRETIARSSVATIKGYVSVTASFGVAPLDPLRMELDTALGLADDALYAAKNAGRNCIRIANSGPETSGPLSLASSA